MPSGRTHDLITFVLAPPTFLAVWVATGSLKLAAVVTCATLFGGLMFGPDLDIQSRQYTRWGVFRFVWLPYKVAFRHRSRLSHGIVLGTLIRVLYFTGAVAALTLLAVYLHARFVAGCDARRPSWSPRWHPWPRAPRPRRGRMSARGLRRHLVGRGHPHLRE